jgi:glutathione S-transferase
MKIYFSAASPFVRKVFVCAHELGLADRIEKLPSQAHPVNRDASIRRHNPLGQVPTFFNDEGDVLYDSRVICEYLNALGDGRLFGDGADRWRILTQAAMGDGLLGAALLSRYEVVARPAPLKWDQWEEGQFGKIVDVIDRIEHSVPDLADRIDIATVTFACGLGYLDFRFPSFDWRNGRPKTAAWFETFRQRPSMEATKPS